MQPGEAPASSWSPALCIFITAIASGTGTGCGAPTTYYNALFSLSGTSCSATYVLGSIVVDHSCVERHALHHHGSEPQRRLLDYEGEFDSLIFGETPRSPSERFPRRKMADAQDTAFLHRTSPCRALATAKRERTIASRRFWRSDIFLRAYTGCHPGMFYSLLIHAALLSVLIASPIPIPRSEVSVKAYLMPIGSRLSAPVARDTGISRHVGGPRQMETLPNCCAPQTILSNPPKPTNHMQTILQPDLPNPPSLENFIHLPNILTLQRLSWRPGPQPGANIALELPPMPAPAAPSPDGEQGSEPAVQDGRNGADDADDTRDTLASACSPLRPAKRSPHPLPNPAGASPKTP